MQDYFSSSKLNFANLESITSAENQKLNPIYQKH